MNYYLKLAIMVAVVGAIFAFVWRKGYLAKLTSYFQETREELKKCTWPSWDELKGSTVLILVAMAMMSLFTMGVDAVVSTIVRAML